MSLSQMIDAENAPSYEDMEKQFAVKAVQHMVVYWSILEKLPGSKLRLSRLDDQILEHFNLEFLDFDPAQKIDEDSIKSKEGKEKWRKFSIAYEKGEKRSKTSISELCYEKVQRPSTEKRNRSSLSGCSSMPSRLPGNGPV